MYLVPFIPSGFWPRLISRLLTDVSLLQLAKNGCGLADDGMLYLNPLDSVSDHSVNERAPVLKIKYFHVQYLGNNVTCRSECVLVYELCQWSLQE